MTLFGQAAHIVGTSDPSTLTGWHHIAWTFNGTGSNVFLDGSLVPATECIISGTGSVDPVDGQSEIESTTPHATNAPTTVGIQRDAQGDTTDWIPGGYDELRVSGSVRYTTQFTPERRVETDLDTIGLWHFDEGTGTSTADSSGNGQAGQLTDSVAWRADDGYGGQFCN